MCSRRTDFENNENDIVYQLFNLLYHSILFTQVRIIEKEIYNRTSNHHLLTLSEDNKKTTGFDNWDLRNHMVDMTKVLVYPLLSMVSIFINCRHFYPPKKRLVFVTFELNFIGYRFKTSFSAQLMFVKHRYKPSFKPIKT